MAYLRMSADCKVYFYATVSGHWECGGCRLATSQEEIMLKLDTVEQCLEHLSDHHVAGHLTPAQWYRVSGQLRGVEERQPDPVIADMVAKASAAGAKVVSDDIDVPAEIRMTTMELLDVMLAEARQMGNEELIREIEEARVDFQSTNRF